VGYVNKNFLRGLQLSDLSAVQASARVWLDTIANVRTHGETQRRPIDLFAEERQQLRQPNPHPYDLARTISAVASSQFRIALDSNHYSVPSRYAHRPMTVKAYPDRVCVYCDNELIARHPRRYGRRLDIEDPEHAKELIAQRGRAREQRLMMRFLALSPDAAAYYEGLDQHRLDGRQHVRKVLGPEHPDPRQAWLRVYGARRSGGRAVVLRTCAKNSRKGAWPRAPRYGPKPRHTWLRVYRARRSGGRAVALRTRAKNSRKGACPRESGYSGELIKTKLGPSHRSERW
jgi:hypothetical protein